MERLSIWDTGLLFFINRRLTHPLNDVIMSLWSAEWPWLLIFVVLCGIAWRKRSLMQTVQLVWIALSIGISDAFAYYGLKAWFGRLRPCKAEEFVRAIEGCAGMVGFPSNHAANAAVFATLWLLFKGPRQGALAIGCALMVGFSRIYLGMHYPSDVIVGFIYGALIGLGSFYILRHIPRLHVMACSPDKSPLIL